MKKSLNFYKELIKKIMHLVEDSLNSEEVAPPKKTSKSSKEKSVPEKAKKADMQFIVKEKNPQLYEVTLKDFNGLFGVGVTPEQALENLIQHMNDKVDALVKNTLTSALHIDEIQNKFKKSMEKLVHNKETNTPEKKRKGLFNKFKKNKKTKLRSFEINIFLKKPFSTESILEKIIKKDIAQMNLAKMPYPRIQHQNAQIPLGLDNQILLKTNSNNEEVPFHLLMDDEGNSLDDDFSFGIVVNLN